MTVPSKAPTGTIRDWLNQNAEVAPDDVAYVFTEGSLNLSWSELASKAKQIAHQLTALGAKKGESIAVMMPNSHDALVNFFGIAFGGFRATMINLAAGSEAISYALSHANVRYAFVAEAQLDLFAEVKPSKALALNLSELSASGNLYEIDPKDQALLMYTSGTTGTPKGVLHSHASLLAGGWTSAVAHQLSSKDRGYCVLPMYHINGLCVTVIGNLISRGQLVVTPKFSASQFWIDIAKYKVTWFSVVPTIISHLLHGTITPSKAVQAHLRFGRSASAPLAPDVQSAFEKSFGVPIIETMGLTETAAQILSNPLPPGQRVIGSPGIAYGNEAEILTADGVRAEPGEEGELIIKGPNVMLGYLNNSQATKDAFTADGWLRTGDLVRKDQKGYFFVTGRLKELIIKGGENIAPREIDEALYANPDVVEAAAFSVPCDIYGERVHAAVKLRDGSKITTQNLIESCVQKLGDFKAPEHVFVLEELPKGPSGKIQRVMIAKLIEEMAVSK